MKFGTWTSGDSCFGHHAGSYWYRWIHWGNSRGLQFTYYFYVCFPYATMSSNHQCIGRGNYKLFITITGEYINETVVKIRKLCSEILFGNQDTINICKINLVFPISRRRIFIWLNTSLPWEAGCMYTVKTFIYYVYSSQ